MDAHRKLWMSVQEAAEYLSCSEESIERRLLKWQWDFAPGKIRYMRIEEWNAISTVELDRQRPTPIRLLGGDVYALLPFPDDLPQAGIGGDGSMNATERPTRTGEAVNTPHEYDL